MIAISVSHNIDETLRRLKSRHEAVQRALPSALNKTAAGMKTRMVRAIAESYRLRQDFIRERLQIRPARRNGQFAFSAALIGNPKGRAKRGSMNVIHFALNTLTRAEVSAWRRQATGKLTRPQIPFQIKRTGGRVYIKGAFVGNNGRTVFERVGKARTPIRPVQTIGVPQMFSTKVNVAAVQAWVSANFDRILERELKYYGEKVK